jgi:hypothetical protein
VAWPVTARAASGAARGRIYPRRVGRCFEREVTAFRKGLNEIGAVEGETATVEYHWLEGQYDRVPALMADLVRSKTALLMIYKLAQAAEKSWNRLRGHQLPKVVVGVKFNDGSR